jgi:Mlc titration factor MtfA (ptsG expression regulator)
MNIYPVIVILLVVLVPIIFWIRWYVNSLRTRRLRETPPPESWQPILDAHFKIVHRLTEAQRQQLFGYMQVFIDRVRFAGCGGQEITEEVKVAIAAQACLLLVGREQKVYPGLKSVLVYPHTYVAGKQGSFGGDNGEGARLGESWPFGVVVLAWNSVLGGAHNLEDGHNVTMHEFAHQLDQVDGAADGAPVLQNRSAYVSWAKVLSVDYKKLRQITSRGKKDVIDRYGATNPAEFFAVATETFFEQPRQLKKKHPALFDELQSYYRVNPLDWEESVGVTQR